MEHFTLSYREVIPDLSAQEDWVEITLNTGGTQSTLQDIKVAEKAGGYCFQNVSLNHNRNRYIYWRSYRDVLELSEISVDFNLYQNNLRYKFTDSPILSVSIAEHEQRYVTILVTTVCSLHRIHFPHPDSVAESSVSGSTVSSRSCNSTSSDSAVDSNGSQSFSIFREASAVAARNPATFYVFSGQNTSGSNSAFPQAAASILSTNGDAFFALAWQAQLQLYIMNCSNGQTIMHQLKDHYIMPRLLSNIKGAIIGKPNSSDGENATSLVFTQINGQVYLVALYRDNHLRLWSTTTLQTICSINCERDGNEQRSQGPQCNTLRKINDTSFCAFLSHSSGAEFVCVHIQDITSSSNSTSSENTMTFIRRKVISAPKLDLAEFDASESRIWALWCNAEGEFSISNFSLVRGMGMQWVSAAMEPPPDRYCVGLEQGVDPREAYCSYIFHPGKFSPQVIAKALFMFRRSNISFDLKHCSTLFLKDNVCQAVEEELQSEIRDFEVTDEEYLEISTRLWERFYSCCEQYHLKTCQPMGLVVLEPLNSVCVVKKHTFSLLRPCEMLEHLMLFGDDVEKNIIVPMHFPGNEHTGEESVNLVTIIAQLEKWLPEDVKLDLDRKLYQLEMPNVFIPKLTDEILASDPDKNILPSNFLVIIRQKLQTITDLRSAMALLLSGLRMDHGNPKAMQTNLNFGHSSRHLSSIGTFFGSNVGVSLLSETVRQMALIRFAICRNLLILQQILIDTYSLSVDILETLRSQYMPDTIIFLQSYYVMVWISETPVNMNSISTHEASIQRLNLLQLTNGSGRIYSDGGKSTNSPLLRVFLNAKGLYAALSIYTENFNVLKSASWHNTLLPLTNIISQLIWAVSFNFTFGEWLFSTCQHIIIEDYVRLLNNWCEWNICSRQFILAISLLDCGETHKAHDLFLQSAKGVLQEPFLTEKILNGSPLAEQIDSMDEVEISSLDIATSNRAIAQYYLKVIHLFEQHNVLDHIISMAEVAIGILDKTDPQLPMFQSIAFNNHLLLEHYEEAYHSLIYNVVMSRRKDCLRQLVVTLFNEKRLDLLMHFPYVGLHEEFENIVESRARSSAIENNEIYDFLYAFHVNNGNMRKASAIMYEQAMRLLSESDNLEAMQKRCSCLLICINALHLIDIRFNWIAKPATSDDNVIPILTSAALAPYNKKTNEANETAKEKVVVLEISDIRKELLYTESLVSLGQLRNDIRSYINAGPKELVILLCNSALFTAALKLAKGFDLTLLPIFESLTTACVRAAEENSSEVWSWLQENDLADLPHRNEAADMAWSLLKKLMEDNEEEESTQIRKSVVKKILNLNAFVPQWLYNDYKLSNCTELLHLYAKHYRLLEAAELAKEIISAMLGAGSEYFSFKEPIAVTNPDMCLPLNILDLLLHDLKENSAEEIEYKQALVELEEVIEKYLEAVERVADDKIQMVLQVEHERQQLTT